MTDATNFPPLPEAFHPDASHIAPDYRDGFNRCHLEFSAYIAPVLAERDALAQRVKELEKDARRLDFMTQRGYYIGWSKDSEVCGVMGIEDEEIGFQSVSPICYEPREAIDAAMQQAGQQEGK